MFKGFAIAIPMAIAVAGAPCAASTMYVISAIALSSVDLINRKHVLIGGIEFHPQPELASDWRPESFRLWTTSHSASGSVLHQFNPATGQVVRSTPLIYPTDPLVQTLAFDVKTGRLFGTSGQSSHALFEIDPDTGVCQSRGNIGSRFDTYGSAFDPDGNLWVSGGDQNLAPVGGSSDRYVLFKVNLTTAAMISEVRLPATSGGPSDIAFRPEDGQLFASNSAFSPEQSLMSINPATGAITPIPLVATQGTSGGIAFGPVPEPTGLLWTLGGLAIMGRRRPRGRRAGLFEPTTGARSS